MDCSLWTQAFHHFSWLILLNVIRGYKSPKKPPKKTKFRGNHKVAENIKGMISRGVERSSFKKKSAGETHGI